MKFSLKYREQLADVRRMVVKIGSRVLVHRSGRPDNRRIRTLVREIANLHNAGTEIVMVTSGAIGAGMEALRMKERPSKLPDLQMAAAVGQTRLMSRYDEYFGKQGCKVGQILLTHADFNHKIRLNNAKRTIENLLRNGVIPIINENDAVADEEIRADLALGDNDYLASHVIRLVRADLLVLLTTSNGVREPGRGGRTKRLRYIEEITRKTLALASNRTSRLSKGGMLTKLKAAQVASQSGCCTVIANGRETDILSRILDGDDVGTIIPGG